MMWRRWRGGSDSSARINLAAVTDAENEHHYPVKLDGTDEAAVSHAVFPELTQRSLQPFADLMWVVQLGNSFVEKLRNAAGDRLVEPVDFFLRGGIELNLSLWS
jgi:hypothetical protein